MISAPQANRYLYAGNSVTTAFAYSSIFENPGDLLVLAVVNNTPTIFVRGTDYTVAGGAGSAGTVTTTVPVPTGTTLIIIGNPPVEQALHLVGGGAAPAAAQEIAYDYLTLLVQRLHDQISRALLLPDSDFSGVNLALPAPLNPGDMFCVNASGTALSGFPSSAARAGLLLGFNGSGLPIPVAGTLTGVVASAFGANFVGSPTAAIAAGVLASFATTVTAAGTTNIDGASGTYQVFTGTSTQNVVLGTPVVFTNPGQTFVFQNRSTGIVTVKTADGTTLQAMAANTQLVLTALTTLGVLDTTAWNWSYLPISGTKINGTFLSLSDAAGVPVHGTNTNDAAAAGYIGEYIEGLQTSFVTVPSSGTWGDGPSLALTAGDWDVSAIISWSANGATTTKVRLGISTTSGNSGTGLTEGQNYIEQVGGPTSVSDFGLVIPPYRMSLAAPTTVYLKQLLSYTVATPTYACRISARRVR